MFGIGNPELGVIMLGLFVVFIMFGFPIAFTLMALGVFFGYFAMGDLIFNLLVQRTYSVMTNDVLISIPLFVFMGYIIERANILDRLFRSLQLAAGPVPASLALATLATCAIFATATVIIMTLLNPKLAPKLPDDERNVPIMTVFRALLTSFAPLAGLIGAALGSIIFGLATPSEAAAMGSLGALLLAVAYGADYSRRWNVILVQIYGALAAAFFVYLIVCGMTDLNVDRRVVTVALFATLLVGIALIP